MEAIPIRTARRGDVPSLLMLWGAMMDEHVKLDPRLAIHADAREHQSRAFSSWIEDPARTVLVAEEANHLVVGYAAGNIVPGNGIQAPARIGQVTDCFVAPRRRRRGIGRRLVSRLLDVLSERGADVVRLQVSALNATSESFWASQGWERLEEILERPASR